MFRAHLPEPEFAAGPESLEVVLATPEQIPWAEIAFPSVRFALERYLEDRVAGRDTLHFSAIDRRLAGR
jgi:hypothetical protein